MKGLAESIAEALEKGYEVQFHKSRLSMGLYTISVLDRSNNSMFTHHIDMDAFRKMNKAIDLDFLLSSGVKSQVKNLNDIKHSEESSD